MEINSRVVILNGWKEPWDIITFGNIVKEIDNSWEDNHTGRDVESSYFEALGDDGKLYNNNSFNTFNSCGGKVIWDIIDWKKRLKDERKELMTIVKKIDSFINNNKY